METEDLHSDQLVMLVKLARATRGVAVRSQATVNYGGLAAIIVTEQDAQILAALVDLATAMDNNDAVASARARRGARQSLMPQGVHPINFSDDRSTSD